MVPKNLKIVVRVLQAARLASRNQRLDGYVDVPLHQRLYPSLSPPALTVRRAVRRDDHVGVALVAHVDRVEGNGAVRLSVAATENQQRALAAAKERLVDLHVIRPSRSHRVHLRRVVVVRLHPHQVLHVEEVLLLEEVEDHRDVLLVRPHEHEARRDHLLRQHEVLEALTVVVHRRVDEHRLALIRSSHAHVERQTQRGVVELHRVLHVRARIRQWRLIAQHRVRPRQRNHSSPHALTTLLPRDLHVLVRVGRRRVAHIHQVVLAVGLLGNAVAFPIGESGSREQPRDRLRRNEIDETLRFGVMEVDAARRMTLSSLRVLSVV